MLVPDVPVVSLAPMGHSSTMPMNMNLPSVGDRAVAPTRVPGPLGGVQCATRCELPSLVEGENGDARETT